MKNQPSLPSSLLLFGCVMVVSSVMGRNVDNAKNPLNGKIMPEPIPAIFEPTSRMSEAPKTRCRANECWCVSNGGKTCNHTSLPNECHDRKDCPDDHYWCDDSKDAGCSTDECWCVSDGSLIINDTCNPDECIKRTDCQDGYWCDDSIKRPECDANECWCMSNGGNTCGATKDEECDSDECYDRNNCEDSVGYWCDDSKCVTIGGEDVNKPCVFPFSILQDRMNLVSKSVESYRMSFPICTTWKHNVPWCYTEVDSNGVGVNGKWGECSPSCLVCKTNGGNEVNKPCVFPFTYKMKGRKKSYEIDSCLQGSGKYWCPTEVDSNRFGVSGKWGYCDVNCFECTHLQDHFGCNDKPWLCHHNKNKCDGSNDCDDGSDESNCNGQWSEWESNWSRCSKTCETGTQFRARKCDNPQPSGDGKDCFGDKQEKRECNTLSCESAELRKEICEIVDCKHPRAIKLCSYKCNPAHSADHEKCVDFFKYGIYKWCVKNPKPDDCDYEIYKELKKSQNFHCDRP